MPSIAGHADDGSGGDNLLVNEGGVLAQPARLLESRS
jgi:hypothetical protein